MALVAGRGVGYRMGPVAARSGSAADRGVGGVGRA